MPSVAGYLTIAACAIHVGLAVLALRRRERSALAMPLLSLAVIASCWTFGSFAAEVTGVRGWHYVDVAISPLLSPAAFWFVAVFVGRRAQLRAAIFVTFGVAGAFGFYSGLGALSETAASFEASDTWAVVFGMIMAPNVVATGWLLLEYLGGDLSPRERERALLLLVSLVGGAVFGATEIAAALGADVPRLGSMATLLMGLVFAVLSARSGLLEERPALGSAIFLGAVAVIALGSVVVLDEVFAASTAIVAVAVAAVALVLALLVRRFAQNASLARERRSRLAFMGRLSDQLAHDLKNPVAAIRGAADLLLEEHARGKPLEPQVEFVSLIRREADRLARLIDTYRRFGRVELRTNEVDVRELLERIAAAPWIDRAEVTVAIDGAIPKIAGDADLLLVVFENLVKNAIEADAKRVVLRAREEERALEIRVEDDGKGMDPRERELAFEELYTTKDMGSGLGLPFARRIVEAHGGRLALKSDKGRGTTLSIALPIDARMSAPPPAPR